MNIGVWPYMQDSKRDTDIKNSLLDSVGEGEGGMIWEGSIETCIIICEVDCQVRCMRRCSGLVHWDDPEGWDGEGGGRGVLDGEHMCTRDWFMSMFGKNHYHIVKPPIKINKFRGKKKSSDFNVPEAWISRQINGMFDCITLSAANTL